MPKRDPNTQLTAEDRAIFHRNADLTHIANMMADDYPDACCMDWLTRNPEERRAFVLFEAEENITLFNQI